MRIVSLLGSATEIVYALGLADRLVGISHECDYPPESQHLPRLSRPRFDPAGLDSGQVDAAVRQAMQEFGSVYEVDVEAMAALKPDLILTQAVCEVCAVPTGSVEDAVKQLPGNPQIVSLDAHDIDGILRTIVDVATAAGIPSEGDRLVAEMQGRIARATERVADSARPRVLMLEWLDPPFTPGHWVPEMVRLAGGDNLAGDAGARSVEVGWESLMDLQPDVLLVEPCGFDLEQALSDAARHRERLELLAPEAFRSGRAWTLHSAWYSRSGPRVVEGIEILAQILHPVEGGTSLAGRAAKLT